jgi:TrmH family RNA methyltransferase
MEQLGRHGRRLKELRGRVRDRTPGEVVVDGRRLIADVVRWGVPLRELYVAARVVDEVAVEGLVAAAEHAWEVPDEAFRQLAPTRNPQGVLAIVDEPPTAQWSAESGLAVYLDGVQEPGNVGAVIRSAAALGAAAVVLSEGCGDPFHWAAVRASAGAALHFPVVRNRRLEPVAAAVRAGGGEIWASGGGGTPVTAWRPRQPTLLLLGCEGRGLGPHSRAKADGEVTIPLDNQIESLNVAVAAGVLLEAYRRISSPG